MVSTDASERFLAAPWLSGVDSAALQALLNVLVEARAPAGATLLAQGQPNDHVAFLIDGSATVSRVTDAGATETLMTLHAPSVFGLTSFFRPQPPGFSVRADTPAWVLTLDHHAHDLLRRNDLRASEQLALAAVRALADRLERLDRRVSAEVANPASTPSKVTEWAAFRSRLFDEANI